jgi:hypothetical protein
MNMNVLCMRVKVLVRRLIRAMVASGKAEVRVHGL